VDVVAQPILQTADVAALEFDERVRAPWKNFLTNSKNIYASSSSAPLPAIGQPTKATTTRIPAIAFGA
jgi:hypothetical protein